MHLWTAFTIGLFGSFHCVGMCGPIALAAGGNSGTGWWQNALLYNLGRVLTYSLAGLIIGLMGKGLFLAGLQRYVSIGIGVVLLVVALFSINLEQKLINIAPVSRLHFQLKLYFARHLGKDSKKSIFTSGILNGFLPCGLVYVALFGSISTGNWFSGVLYMLLFGLGTFPLMILTLAAGNRLHFRLRQLVYKAYPFFLIFFALLFLFRGLNFSIPGDFFFYEQMQNLPMCH